ncbi:hypothetical protein DXG03_009495 [Asterophora parasitica]|uniref:Uncharacterized protein n=1 Tax=Asterophora parasitica TaxID=117018 RepID=A0A9P7K8N9_9AGAR|nr:hypothetical protein DXG03_009495 [Asterophora parasitica]
MHLKPTAQEGPFTADSFYERLAKWIAVDDQLSEDDLPHCTKLTKIIINTFKREYTKMVDDIQNSLGCVALTIDIWSQMSLAAHMAITAHYIALATDGQLVLQSCLIAFQRLKGSHTGKHLAEVVWQVINELKIVGYAIQLDKPVY